MALIHTLRPNVRREEALRSFRPPGLTGWLHDRQQGPLRRIADAYVPFRLYRVEVENGTRRSRRLLAVDAVRGFLDLYSFERVPEASELVRIEAHNALPSQLEETCAREIVIEQARRIIYRTGFFRLRSVKITANLIPLDFHVPYWLGFSGVNELAELAVLDAVRRRLEGAKARELFQTWLTSDVLLPDTTHHLRPSAPFRPSTP